MSKEVIYKFYDLESLTQEELNGLARERNTLAEENKQLNDKLKELKKYTDYLDIEKCNLENALSKLEKNIQNRIYDIEPKGTKVNYNCEYDSEEDYIKAKIEQSRLNTLKEVLNRIKELKEINMISDEKEILDNCTMIYIGNKNFHCECGANVFTKYKNDIFKCHGCDREYKGVECKNIKDE